MSQGKDSVGVRFTSIVDPAFLGNINAEFAKVQANAVKHLSAIGLEGFGSILSTATSELNKVNAVIQRFSASTVLSPSAFKSLHEAVPKAEQLQAALTSIRLGDLAGGAKALGDALGKPLQYLEAAKLESSTILSVVEKLTTQFAVAGIKSSMLASSAEVSGIKYKALNASVSDMVNIIAKADPAQFLGAAGEQAALLTTKVQYAVNAVNQLKKELDDSQKAADKSGPEGDSLSAEAQAKSIEKVAELQTKLAAARAELEKTVKEVTEFQNTTVAAFKKINEQDIIDEKQTKAASDLRASLAKLRAETADSGNMFAYHVDRVRMISQYYANGGKSVDSFNNVLAGSKKFIQDSTLAMSALAAAQKAEAETSTRSTVAIKSQAQAQTEASRAYNTAVNVAQNAIAAIDADTKKYVTGLDRAVAKVGVLTDLFNKHGNSSKVLKAQYSSLIVEIQRLAQMNVSVKDAELAAKYNDSGKYTKAAKDLKEYDTAVQRLQVAISDLNVREAAQGVTLDTLTSRYVLLSTHVERFGARTQGVRSQVEAAAASLRAMLASMATAGTKDSFATSTEKVEAEIAAINKKSAALAKARSEVLRIETEERRYGQTLESVSAKLAAVVQYNNAFGNSTGLMATRQTQLTAELLRYVGAQGKVLSSSNQVKLTEQAKIATYTQLGQAEQKAYTNLRMLDAEFVVHGNESRKLTSQLQVLLEHFNRFGMTNKTLVGEFDTLSARFKQVATDSKSFSRALSEANKTSNVTALAAYNKEVQNLAANLAKVDAQAKISGNTKQAEIAKLRLLEEFTRRWGKANKEAVAELARVRSVTSPFFTELLESMKSIVAMQIKYSLGMRAIYGTMNMFSTGFQSIIQYEQQLQNIQSITRASEPDMVKLSAAIREQGLVTKFSATEIATATTTLGQAGFTAAESVDSVKSITALATATMAGMDETVDLVTTTIRAFNLEASETTRVVNLLAAATNESKLTIDKMRVAFNYIASTGNLIGLSLETVATAMGLMANAGIRASTIGTGLRYTLTSLTEPSVKLVSALNKIGLTIDQVDPRVNDLGDILMKLKAHSFDSAAAFEAFGKRGGDAIAALVNSAEKFDTFRDSITGTNRAFKMAEEQMTPVENSWKKIKNILIDVAIDVGTVVLPALHGLLYVLQTLTSVVKIFTEGVFSTTDSMSDLAARAVSLGAAVAALTVLWKSYLSYRVAAAAAVLSSKFVELRLAVLGVAPAVLKLRAVMLTLFGSTLAPATSLALVLGAVAAAIYVIVNASDAWQRSQRNAAIEAAKNSAESAKAAQEQQKQYERLAAIMESKDSSEDDRQRSMERFIKLSGQYNELLDEQGKLTKIAADRERELLVAMKEVAENKRSEAVGDAGRSLIAVAAEYNKELILQGSLEKQLAEYRNKLNSGVEGEFAGGGGTIAWLDYNNALKAAQAGMLASKKRVEELDETVNDNIVTLAAYGAALPDKALEKTGAFLAMLEERFKGVSKEAKTASERVDFSTALRASVGLLDEALQGVSSGDLGKLAEEEEAAIAARFKKLIDATVKGNQGLAERLKLSTAEMIELLEKSGNAYAEFIQASSTGSTTKEAQLAAYYKFAKSVTDDITKVLDDAQKKEEAIIDAELEKKKNELAARRSFVETDTAFSTAGADELVAINRKLVDAETKAAQDKLAIERDYTEKKKTVVTGAARATMEVILAGISAERVALTAAADARVSERAAEDNQNLAAMRQLKAESTEFSKAFADVFSSSKMLGSFDEIVQAMPDKFKNMVDALSLPDAEKEKLAASWNAAQADIWTSGSGSYEEKVKKQTALGLQVAKDLADANEEAAKRSVAALSRQQEAEENKLAALKASVDAVIATKRLTASQEVELLGLVADAEKAVLDKRFALTQESTDRTIKAIDEALLLNTVSAQEASEQKAEASAALAKAETDYATKILAITTDKNAKVAALNVKSHTAALAALAVYHKNELREVEKKYADAEAVRQRSLASGAMMESEYEKARSAGVVGYATEVSALYDSYVSKVGELNAALQSASGEGDLEAKQAAYDAALEVAEDYYGKLTDAVKDLRAEELKAIKDGQAARKVSFDLEMAYKQALKNLGKTAEGTEDMIGADDVSQLYATFYGDRNTKPSIVEDLERAKSLAKSGDFDAASAMFDSIQGKLDELEEKQKSGAVSAKQYAELITAYGAAVKGATEDELLSVESLTEEQKEAIRNLTIDSQNAANAWTTASRAFFMSGGGADTKLQSQIIAEGFAKIAPEIAAARNGASTETALFITAVYTPLQSKLAELDGAASELSNKLAFKAAIDDTKLTETATLFTSLNASAKETRDALATLKLPDELLPSIANANAALAGIPTSTTAAVNASTVVIGESMRGIQGLANGITFDAVTASARTSAGEISGVFDDLRAGLSESIVTKIVLDLKTELGSWADTIASKFNSEKVVEAVNRTTAAIVSADASINASLKLVKQAIGGK